MQHVDDGTIHAWLDRQVTDAEEIARIETHLRECPSCHARLADERATLEQADALLAAAAPLADADRPAFETIVARAGSGGSGPAGSRSVYRTWVMPVSWAASVALAAALGWSVRDRMPLSVEPRGDAPASQAATSQTSSPPAVQEQTQSGDTQAVAARSASGPNPESRIPNPGSQESSRRQSSAVAGATADRRSGIGGSSAPPTVSPEQPVFTLRGALGESETGGAAINVTPASPPPAPAPTTPPPAPIVANGQEAAFTLSAEANGADAVARAPEARAAAPAPGAGAAPAGGGGGGGGARGGGRGGGGGGRGGRGGGPAPGGGGANQGRVVFDGLAIAGGTAGATDANAWRALPRTDAAAQSGMALYGIDGLMPMATMLSMDNTVVRTIYRLESGETIELVQQKVVANNAAESAARAGTAGAAGATTASQTQTQGQTQGQGQGQGQLGQAQSDRPAEPPQWTTMRNDVRLTLRGAANLNALGDRLRLD